MRSYRLRNLAIACLVLSASPMAVRADSVADVMKDYNQKRTQLIRDRKATAESLSQLAEEAAKRVDSDSVTVPEILLLTNAGITSYKPLAEKLTAKLDGLKSSDAKANATEQLLALHVAASAKAETSERLRERLAAGLANPGTALLLNSDQAHMALMPITAYLRTRKDEVDPVLSKLLPMLENVKSPLGNSGGALLMSLWQVAEVTYKEQASKRETARVAVVTALERAYKATADATPEMKERYERMIDLLNGPSTRGTLIGNKAPELDILWSTNSGIKSLASLKGKVVVLDFWATWCGPCIASFPNVRDLQQHYKDKPVVIVGVTSPQGRHYGAKGSVDTKGDPQKEFGLMPEFIQEKMMTWDVVFSRQNVFNPAYGVNGIPHVAIIDAKGNVRHNGLHPASPMAEKIKLIDALLAEMEAKK